MRKIIGIAAAIAVAGFVAAGAALASHHGQREGRDEEEGYEGHERGDRGRHSGHERGEGHGGRRARSAAESLDPQARALYRKECGACHLDFPPSMLPAASHRRVMADLEHHFGQNAELDAEARARLERWLVENSADAGAGRGASGKAESAPSRITQLPWFARKHRPIAAQVVARPSIRSIAHCAACHPGAADWDFEDDRAKIPPG